MEKKPTHEAWVSGKLFENGIGHLLISRFKSEGRVECGVFLLDVYCLGVKDAFFTLSYSPEYEREFLDRIFASEEMRESMTPAGARKLVEDSVAYARSLGLEPHPDHKKACRVLGGIDASTCTQTFTFGKDGKPFYVQGPHDSALRVQQILQALNRTRGPNNYLFMLASPVTQEMLGLGGIDDEDEDGDVEDADPGGEADEAAPENPRA